MFVEYIYIYIWTVQPRNGTPKHSETETFHSNWKNKTPTETELTTLLESSLLGWKAAFWDE
jgi:hypothetical protein